MSNRNAALLDSNIGDATDAGPQLVAADTAPTLDGRLASLDAERIRYALEHVRKRDGSVHTFVRVNRDDEQRAYRGWLKRSTRSLRMLTLSRPLVAAGVATRARGRRSPRSRAARRTTARLASARPGDDDGLPGPAAERLADRFASLQRLVVASLVALAVIEIATLAAELAS